MNKLNNKKELAQPSKIKTGGSTFKNPINQTDKKSLGTNKIKCFNKNKLW